ncbi:hypothetical protein SAMN05444745_1532 [Arthrobacter sp. OV608]|nr:hypothetical protein SAMN05444745_1532 [Arthrobacter sp. OV608]
MIRAGGAWVKIQEQDQAHWDHSDESDGISIIAL